MNEATDGLRVVDLNVQYPGFTLRNVNLEVRRGEFLALVGTNGSGKSTLLRAMLGWNGHLVDGSSAWAGGSLLARDRTTRQSLGYVSDSRDDVMSGFTAAEFWNYCALVRERAGGDDRAVFLRRARDLGRALDFPLRSKEPIRSLSLGTARKAQIVAVLAADPDLVVLDEPFIGLDFIAARALEDILAGVRDAGVTVIASGHDLGISGRLADHIAVLHDGAIVLDRRCSPRGDVIAVEAMVQDALRSARQSGTAA